MHATETQGNKLALLRAQLRLSAITAALSAAQVFIVPVGVASVMSALALVFRSFGAVDWKFVLAVNGVFSALWFLTVFVSTLADLRAEDRRDVSARPVFGPATFFIIIYGVLIVLSVCMSQGMWREGDSLWDQLIPLSLVVLAWHCWPRAIRFGPDSILQRTRFGKLKRLEYKDVLGASFLPTDGTTIVTGECVTIEHTVQHANVALFQALVEERTGKKFF